ncbi:MAG: N-formylglutamate amidohydrolase [Pseudomonadota bacterium]
MKLPLIVSLPHCSSLVPRAIRSDVSLSDGEICESTDIGTGEIFGLLPAEEVLRAPWSRIVVDLNRGTHQRGPRGVIAQVDYYGRPVYQTGLSPGEAEVERRLGKYYWPYHNRLKEALYRPNIRGLVDCHSLNGIGPPEAPDRGRKRKDIILGNNGNLEGDMDPSLGEATCPAEAMHKMKQVFQGAGFSVAFNEPYSGGFIVRHYGREGKKMGKVALQIEINQDLFVEPVTRRVVTERMEGVRARVIQCLISSMIWLLRRV